VLLVKGPEVQFNSRYSIVSPRRTVVERLAKPHAELVGLPYRTDQGLKRIRPPAVIVELKSDVPAPCQGHALVEPHRANPGIRFVGDVEARGVLSAQLFNQIGSPVGRAVIDD